MVEKKIYHRGWWLRNFTSFCDFNVPKGYNKLILLKKEFEKEFTEKFSGIDKNIKILCGAGVNSKKDVEIAIKLGAKGILLASAVVKAANQKKVIEELISAF